MIEKPKNKDNELTNLKHELDYNKRIVSVAIGMQKIQPFVAIGILALAITNKEFFGFFALSVPLFTTLYFEMIKSSYKKDIKEQEIKIQEINEERNIENSEKQNNITLVKPKQKPNISPKKIYINNYRNTATKVLIKKL